MKVMWMVVLKLNQAAIIKIIIITNKYTKGKEVKKKQKLSIRKV